MRPLTIALAMILAACSSSPSAPDGALPDMTAPPIPGLCMPRFRAPTEYASQASLTVAIGDLNGDARPDVVTTNADQGFPSLLYGPVKVYMNRGAGRLGDPVSYSTMGHIGMVAIGDLNGDGAPDLATSNGGRLEKSGMKR